MGPKAKQMEQKLPEWSEVKKIDETNKELRKILENLNFLEKNNPEHPSVKEKKDIIDNNSTILKNFKNEILWINEDNLPTDENWDEISVADIWPEWIPEELNN